MAGTRAGGLKAAATNKKKYGKDFYRINGAEGGRISHTGGFAANPTLARLAGSVGGKKSTRGSQVASDKLTAKVAELADKGLTYAEISKKLGISAYCAGYHARKAKYEVI